MTNGYTHGKRLLFAIAAMALLTGANAEQSYYPLKAGQVADYRYTLTKDDMGVDSTSGIVTLTHLAPKVVKGNTVIPIIITATGQLTASGAVSATSFSFYVEDASGVYEYATQGSEDPEPVIFAAPKYVLKYPIKVGAHWETKDSTSIILATPITISNTIESVREVVKTPAGTYKQCVEVKGAGKTGTITNELGTLTQIDVENRLWYAPGVGLVQAVMTETNNGYNELLKQKYLTSGKWEQRLQTFKGKP